MGGNFLNTTWADVATAVEVSAFSFKSLAVAVRPLMSNGGSVVGLSFDARFAWPVYDWMGVAKAALESTSRYLARDLGSGWHPGQHRGRRTPSHHGGQVDPRLRARCERIWSGRHLWAGTSTTRNRPPRPAWHSCRTGSRPRPARSLRRRRLPLHGRVAEAGGSDPLPVSWPESAGRQAPSLPPTMVTRGLDLICGGLELWELHHGQPPPATHACPPHHGHLDT